MSKLRNSDCPDRTGGVNLCRHTHRTVSVSCHRGYLKHNVFAHIRNAVEGVVDGPGAVDLHQCRPDGVGPVPFVKGVSFGNAAQVVIEVRSGEDLLGLQLSLDKEVGDPGREGDHRTQIVIPAGIGVGVAVGINRLKDIGAGIETFQFGRSPRSVDPEFELHRRPSDQGLVHHPGHRVTA